MSNYSVEIKAKLNVESIREQLKQLGENFKPISIDFAKNINMGDIANQIENATLATAKMGSSGEVAAVKLKSLGQSVDVVVNATERGTTIGLNYESAQKRVTKATEDQEKQNIRNQQSLSAMQLRINGLTDAQKKEIETQLGGVTVQEKLNQISALGTTNIQQQTSEISGLTKQISAASYGITNFAGSMDYMIQRFMQLGLYIAIFRESKQAISSMIDTVSGLDASIVELRKVTDLTGDSLDAFVTKAYNVGAQVARTGQEVVDAAAIFSRSGYDIQDALDLSKTAMVMMNVGDNIGSVSNAATAMISILKGFNMEASQSGEILDIINEISNTSAINFEDLTEGLTRTSAVFNQAGVSIEKTSALLTGTQEVLQNIGFETRYLNHSAYVQKCA